MKNEGKVSQIKSTLVQSRSGDFEFEFDQNMKGGANYDRGIRSDTLFERESEQISENKEGPIPEGDVHISKS